MNHKTRSDSVDHTDLKQRMAKGVAWVSAATVGAKVISVVTTLILARLLSPSDFGVVALASIVMNALYLFNDLGIGPAIIHSKRDRDKVASTALILMPLFGALLTLIAIMTAPFTANFLGNPSATNIIRILSFNLLFSSLAVVPNMLLEKDMAFRRKFIPDFFPVIAYLITTVTLASVFKLGAYSLAIGQLVQGIFLVILSWFVCTWRPRFGFDRAIARELWGFGKHILGGSIIAYLATNLDNMFVSRKSGPTQLGYYTLSYSIANLPATHMADMFSRVLFPSFITINDDLQVLKRAYVKSIQLVVLLTFPVLGLIAGLSYPFVKVILGDKWLPMAPILAALTIFTAFRILSSITGNLILAIGKPRIILTTGVISLINQVVALYIFVSVLGMGGLGAAIAVGLASTISWIVVYFFVRKHIYFGWYGTIVKFSKWVLPSLIIAGLGLWSQTVFSASLEILLLSVVALITIYVLLLKIIREYDEVKDSLVFLLKKRVRQR